MLCKNISIIVSKYSATSHDVFLFSPTHTLSCSVHGQEMYLTTILILYINYQPVLYACMYVTTPIFYVHMPPHLSCTYTHTYYCTHLVHMLPHPSCTYATTPILYICHHTHLVRTHIRTTAPTLYICYHTHLVHMPPHPSCTYATTPILYICYHTYLVCTHTSYHAHLTPALYLPLPPGVIHCTICPASTEINTDKNAGIITAVVLCLVAMVIMVIVALILLVVIFKA